MKGFSVISDSPERTREIGCLLGGLLQKGALVALIGELGAGKTCFVKGLADGLGISDNEYVRSPSFVIINEYRGRTPLYHIDLYRVNNEEELGELNLEDYIYGNGVTVIEWADKGILSSLEGFIKVCFSYLDEYRRKLDFSGDGLRKDILTRLKALVSEV